MICIILTYIYSKLCNEYKKIPVEEINNTIFLGNIEINSIQLSEGLKYQYIYSFKIYNNNVVYVSNLDKLNYSRNYSFYSIK